MTQRTSRTANSLLPCPFCGTGGGAIALHMLDSVLYGEDPGYWVSCCICGCTVGINVLCNGACRPFFATAEAAAESWNRREG